MLHFFPQALGKKKKNTLHYSFKKTTSLIIILTLMSGQMVPFFSVFENVYAADDGLPAILLSFTSSTTDGIYNTGDIINITANFDEPVDGTSIMDVTLDTGVQVNLVGDGDTTMSGTYSVNSSESSGDLTIVSIDNASVTTVEDSSPVTETSYTIPGGQNLGDNAQLYVNAILNYSACQITAPGNNFFATIV